MKPDFEPEKTRLDPTKPAVGPAKPTSEPEPSARSLTRLAAIDIVHPKGPTTPISASPDLQ